MVSNNIIKNSYKKTLLLCNGKIIKCEYGWLKYTISGDKKFKIYYNVDNIMISYDRLFKKYKFLPIKGTHSKYMLKYKQYSEYKIKKIQYYTITCKLTKKE